MASRDKNVKQMTADSKAPHPIIRERSRKGRNKSEMGKEHMNRAIKKLGALLHAKSPSKRAVEEEEEHKPYLVLPALRLLKKGLPAVPEDDPAHEPEEQLSRVEMLSRELDAVASLPFANSPAALPHIPDALLGLKATPPPLLEACSKDQKVGMKRGGPEIREGRSGPGSEGGGGLHEGHPPAGSLRGLSVSRGSSSPQPPGEDPPPAAVKPSSPGPRPEGGRSRAGSLSGSSVRAASQEGGEHYHRPPAGHHPPDPPTGVLGRGEDWEGGHHGAGGQSPSQGMHGPGQDGGAGAAPCTPLGQVLLEPLPRHGGTPGGAPIGGGGGGGGVGGGTAAGSTGGLGSTGRRKGRRARRAPTPASEASAAPSRPWSGLGGESPHRTSRALLPTLDKEAVAEGGPKRRGRRGGAGSRLAAVAEAAGGGAGYRSHAEAALRQGVLSGSPHRLQAAVRQVLDQREGAEAAAGTGRTAVLRDVRTHLLGPTPSRGGALSRQKSRRMSRASSRGSVSFKGVPGGPSLSLPLSDLPLRPDTGVSQGGVSSTARSAASMSSVGSAAPEPDPFAPLGSVQGPGTYWVEGTGEGTAVDLGQLQEILDDTGSHGHDMALPRVRGVLESPGRLTGEEVQLWRSTTTAASQLQTRIDKLHAMALGLEEGVVYRDGKKDWRAMARALINVFVDSDGHGEVASRLDLSHVLIRYGEARGIVRCLALPRNRHIHALVLRGCGLDDAKVAMLGHAVYQCARHLGRLDLSDNPLTHHSVDSLLPLMGQPGHRAALQDLRLSRTRIGDQGVSALSRLLLFDPAMTRLDLDEVGAGALGAAELGIMLQQNIGIEHLAYSGNMCHLNGAKHIAEGAENHPRLRSITLARSGIGDESGSHLVDRIALSDTIQHLDLSGNALGARSSLVLTNRIRVNKVLQSIRLDHNPLGRYGASKIIEAFVRTPVSALHTLSMNGCVFIEIDSNPEDQIGFDEKNPDGLYKLDLSKPVEREIAGKLHELWAEGTGRWRREKYCGKYFTITSAMNWEERMPLRGVLELRFISMARLPEAATPITRRKFACIWSPALMRETEAWRWEYLDVLVERSFVTASQAGRVLRSFIWPQERTRVCLRLFGRICDPENMEAMWSHLPRRDRMQLMEDIGMLQVFNPANPTGRYQLNLSNQVDFTVACRLITAFSEELHLKVCRPRQGEFCWRNVFIDGVPYPNGSINPSSFVIPRSGIMRLDYVSYKDATNQPPSASPVRALSAMRFALLKSKLQMPETPEPFVFMDAMLTLDYEIVQNIAFARSHSNAWRSTAVDTIEGLQVAHDGVDRVRASMDGTGKLVGAPGERGSRGEREGDAAGEGGRGGSSDGASSEGEPEWVPRIQDEERALHCLRLFSVDAWITCAQLRQIMELFAPAADPVLPHPEGVGEDDAEGGEGGDGDAGAGGTATFDVLMGGGGRDVPEMLVEMLMTQGSKGLVFRRIEVAVMFWARLVDRQAFMQKVVSRLPPLQQVSVGQRLGWLNIYNQYWPDQYYILRLSEKDEFEVCRRLVDNASRDQGFTNIMNLSVNGSEPKRLRENHTLWVIITGNRRNPDNYVQFTYRRSHRQREESAVRAVQSVWRARMERRQFAEKRKGARKIQAAWLLKHYGVGGQQHKAGSLKDVMAKAAEQSLVGAVGADGNEDGGGLTTDKLLGMIRRMRDAARGKASAEEAARLAAENETNPANIARIMSEPTRAERGALAVYADRCRKSRLLAPRPAPLSLSNIAATAVHTRSMDGSAGEDSGSDEVFYDSDDEQEASWVLDSDWCQILAGPSSVLLEGAGVVQLRKYRGPWDKARGVFGGRGRRRRKKKAQVRTILARAVQAASHSRVLERMLAECRGEEPPGPDSSSEGEDL